MPTQKSGDSLHEPRERLSEAAQDRHRARMSLNEELEAVDWYDQRIEATQDDELRRILTHNRDEENEHAAMLVGWLRKRDPVLDAQLARPGSEPEREDGGGREATPSGWASHLRRHDAPFAASVWKRLDEEAARALRTYLGARRLVEVEGPHGWERSSVNLGRVVKGGGDVLRVEGLELALREVQPLIELRVPFSVPRSEIEAIERGADDSDLRALVEACRRIARAEDRIAFHGFAAGHVHGMIEGSTLKPVPMHDDFMGYPSAVAEAIERLRAAGTAGPYAIALGPRWYDGLARTVGPGGYPILEHVRRLLGGPTVWAPALDDGVVVSTRGGDHRLVVGEDVTIGYRGHDVKDVFLFVEETMTFRLLTAEAAVALKTPTAR